MPFPAHSRASPARYGKGGITIACTPPGRLAAANSPTNAAAKSRSPFIFQFPATIRGRMYVSSKTQGRQFYLRRNLSSPAAQAWVRLRADAAPSWRGVSLFARQGRSAVRPGAARRAFARTRGDAAQAVRAHPALTRAQYI